MTFDRKCLIALVGIVAAIVTGAGLTLTLTREHAATWALSSVVLDRDQQLHRVLEGLVELESRERSYLETEDRAQLQSYDDALGRMDHDLAQLAALWSGTGDADHARDIDPLRGAVAARRERLQRAIDRVRAQEPAAALMGAGLAETDRIRALLRRLENDDAAALRTAQARTDARTAAVFGGGGVIAVMLMGLLAWAYTAVRADERLRDRLAGAERDHVADLEHRVAERTEALERAHDRVAFEEARLRGIFGSAFDAIVVIDTSQRIVQANEAAAAMFGRPLMRGEPLEGLIPEALRARHREHVTAFGRGVEDARRMGTEAVGLRANGDEFPIEVSISRAVDGETLYTAIVRDLTERRHLQTALETSHADLQRLIQQQDRVQESERKRIARDLHDDLQQALSVILLDLGMAKSRVGTGRADAIAPIDSAHQLALDAVASLRRIVDDLRPPMLDELGLVPALEALAQRVSRPPELTCRFVGSAMADPFAGCDAEAALCMYRVAQEALNNVIKHAQASTVTMELAPDGEAGVRLEVRDDGVGIDAHARRKLRSFGLLGMSERVRAAGGVLEIRAGESRGCTVEVRIPRRATTNGASVHGTATDGEPPGSMS